MTSWGPAPSAPASTVGTDDASEGHDWRRIVFGGELPPRPYLKNNRLPNLITSYTTGGKPKPARSRPKPEVVNRSVTAHAFAIMDANHQSVEADTLHYRNLFWSHWQDLNSHRIDPVAPNRTLPHGDFFAKRDNPEWKPFEHPDDLCYKKINPQLRPPLPPRPQANTTVPNIRALLERAKAQDRKSRPSNREIDAALTICTYQTLEDDFNYWPDTKNYETWFWVIWSQSTVRLRALMPSDAHEEGTEIPVHTAAQITADGKRRAPHLPQRQREMPAPLPKAMQWREPESYDQSDAESAYDAVSAIIDDCTDDGFTETETIGGSDTETEGPISSKRQSAPRSNGDPHRVSPQAARVVAKPLLDNDLY